MQSSSVSARQTNIPLFHKNRSGPAATYCRAVSRSGFSRNCRSRRADAVKRFAKFQIAVAGGGARRRDAERQQRLGMPLDNGISGIDNRTELIDRLDDVIGREDADSRLGVAAGKNRRAESDGVERVAPARLAEKLPRAKPGQAPERSPRRAICPAQTKHRSGGSSPSSRPTAISSRLRPPISGINCFGSAARLMGQSRVPEPPAMITAYRMKMLRNPGVDAGAKLRHHCPLSHRPLSSLSTRR